MSKGAVKYAVKVQHYGEHPQEVKRFPSKWQAQHFLNLEAEILKGYYPRNGFTADGTFMTFGAEDIVLTRLWVVRVKGGK